jgi:hypothetical protein
MAGQATASFGATISCKHIESLVKWCATIVSALDNAGRAGRAPLFLDPLGSPQYQGTIVPDAPISTPLPVFHWFVQTPTAAETATGTRSSLFYDGEFYDNIFVRLRGGTSRSAPKKSYKVEFNEGEHFKLRDGVPRVSEFDWNTTYTDKSYNRKGHLLRRLPRRRSIRAWRRSTRIFARMAHSTVSRFGPSNPTAIICGAGASIPTAHSTKPDSMAARGRITRLTSCRRVREEDSLNEDKSDLQSLLNGLALTGNALGELHLRQRRCARRW